MTSPLRLVVFDCDGTLVDSQHMIVAAMNRAFDAHGLEALPREQVLSIVGLSLEEAIQALVPHVEAPIRTRITESYKGAFFLTTISTSRSSSVRKAISRSTEKPSSL